MLQIDGRRIVAVCSDLLLFRPDREYLLYLHYIPQTGGYVAGPGGFVFSNGKALGLGKSGSSRRSLQLKFFIDMGRDHLLELAKQAAAKDGRGRRH